MDSLQEQVIKLTEPRDRKALEEFLNSHGLAMDKNLEYSMVLTDGSRIAATGSFTEKVLKCIAVDDQYKGMGLSAKVITHLVNEQYRRGRTHLFIYTKPENKQIFSDLGFHLIAEVPYKVVLMENRQDGITRYLHEISSESGNIVPSAAVVVNCNPFTLGHQYLLEYAASRCQKLHIFVVWEDRSSFPAEIRYQLVKEGVSHLTNVVIHKGKDYIISAATFPSYFIKEYEDIVETHAQLDLMIFSHNIATALNIQKRFIGEEPYCAVTSTYNKTMQTILPREGIEVEEVPRLTTDGAAISASRVRKLIRRGKIQSVEKLVPQTTYQFLLSSEAGEIIRQIQSDCMRH
ncbi:[citrate (pro-3S)-lyase] ligase [Desulfosporosinus orientis]|nr:[citrate (pro-3S)-lyase] ligase [Desulfosporosinus orientis]